MQERKLTRRMKILLSKKGLNVENWRYLSCTSDTLVIIHKYSLQPKIVKLK